MSDIVERLRKGIVGNRTADEAADEIERLRKENQQLHISITETDTLNAGLLAALKIYVHAYEHDTAPPVRVQHEARAAIEKAEGHE